MMPILILLFTATLCALGAEAAMDPRSILQQKLNALVSRSIGRLGLSGFIGVLLQKKLFTEEDLYGQTIDEMVARMVSSADVQLVLNEFDRYTTKDLYAWDFSHVETDTGSYVQANTVTTVGGVVCLADCIVGDDTTDVRMIACQNGGVAIGKAGTCSCGCEAGYTGQFCETEAPPCNNACTWDGYDWGWGETYENDNTCDERDRGGSDMCDEGTDCDDCGKPKEKAKDSHPFLCLRGGEFVQNNGQTSGVRYFEDEPGSKRCTFPTCTYHGECEPYREFCSGTLFQTNRQGQFKLAPGEYMCQSCHKCQQYGVRSIDNRCPKWCDSYATEVGNIDVSGGPDTGKHKQALFNHRVRRGWDGLMNKLPWPVCSDHQTCGPGAFCSHDCSSDFMLNSIDGVTVKHADPVQSCEAKTNVCQSCSLCWYQSDGIEAETSGPGKNCVTWCDQTYGGCAKVSTNGVIPFAGWFTEDPKEPCDSNTPCAKNTQYCQTTGTGAALSGTCVDVYSVASNWNYKTFSNWRASTGSGADYGATTQNPPLITWGHSEARSQRCARDQPSLDCESGAWSFKNLDSDDLSTAFTFCDWTMNWQPGARD